MLTRGQRRSRRHSADRCHGVGRWWRRSTADQAHCVEPFSRATIDPGRDLARGTYLMILGLQYSASHRQELELLAWIGQRRGRQRPPKGLLEGLGERSAVHSREIGRE